MEKSDIKNVFDVLKEGTSHYFKHFFKLTKYMAFPVLGQVLGIIVIIITTTILLTILPHLNNKYQFFQTSTGVICATIISTFPGLAILLRALWKYLAAYGTISSMTVNMTKSGNIYDIAAHDELINRAAPQYILLWIIFSIFTVLALLPIFWVPAIILFVYFVLIFQVFTLDEANNNGGKAINSFRQSFYMIKGHFWATGLLLAAVALVSYFVVPETFCFAIRQTYLTKALLSLLNLQPESLILPYFTAETIVNIAIKTVISTLLIMFTLPMRAITWTLWYKKLAPKFHREQRKAKKSNVVKLDKRILDRAMEDFE